ncbi:MAG: hypothetical protein WHV28_06600 [Bacteroidota bacterium]
MEEKYQIIYEYLDGELPPVQESELFALLATDQEARNEMKSALAIKEAVRSDSVAFVPPIKSTNKIFSALGFSEPSAIAATASISKFAALKNWLLLQTKYIATGISSAIVTAAIMLMLLPKENANNSISNVSSTKIYDPKETIAQQQQPMPEIKEKVVYKYIVVEQKNPDSKSVASDDQVIKLSSSSPEIIKPENNLNAGRAQMFPMNINITNLLPEEILPDKQDSKISFEIKGLSYASDFEEKVRPAEKQSLNNSSFSVIYDYSNEFAFGLNYSRENFYQKFEGYENNQLYQYEQNPNFETFSLLGRYSPEFLKFNYVKIYSQAAIGGNKVGFVGRLGIGAEITIFKEHSLQVGYDISNMYYKHQSKWFSSSKKGLAFGVKLKL